MLVALVSAHLVWGAVTAPPTSDGAFDLPTLVPAAVVAPVATTAPPTTTTTIAPAPVYFDPSPPGRPNRGGDSHPEVVIPAIGMMEIEKIGLVHPIFEGLDVAELHWGPGHWPGSAMPGQPGNAVFAGHRVTHTRPFLDLDQLAAGDEIHIRTARGSFTYLMTESLIVEPDATWIADPTPDATLTLFGCHPKFSARQRYVVRAKLVEPAPPAPPAAVQP